MKIKFKKAISLALVCLSVALMAGCGNVRIKRPTRLKNRAIILAVGIDRDEEKDGYIVTAQKFSPNGAGAMSAIDPSKTNDKVMVGEGKSITEGFLNMQRKHGKEIFLGNNSYIIFGKKTAEKGLGEFLSFFNSSYEQNQSATILISETTARDICENKVTQDIMPASSLEKVTEKSKGITTTGKCYFYSLEADFLSEKRSAIVPAVKCGKTYDDKDIYEMVGAYFLEGDRIKDMLSYDEARGYLILKGDYNSMFYLLEDRGESYGIFLSPKKEKTKVRIENGRLIFDFEIELIGELREAVGEQIKKTDRELTQRLQEKMARQIEKIALDFLRHTATENGCDCLKLSLLTKQRLPKEYKKIEKDFNKYLKNARFNVDARFKLNNLGLEIA